MRRDARPVLVIGATGFLGRQVVGALLCEGHRVRCLVRNSQRGTDLAGERVEVVPGDMLDAAAVARGAASARAVIVCVHTLSKQAEADPTSDYMEVEEAGLRAIIEACRSEGIRRVLYVTAIGAASDAASTWLRGRSRTERLVLDSGLDATVLRPGMIVGPGGAGFGMVERAARRRVAVLLASRTQRFRTIAVADLACQVVALLGEPASFGCAFDVGSDDVLTMDQMIDLVADHLGRRRPVKVHLPRRALAPLAPLIERAARMPRGAVGGFLGAGSDADMVGDVTELRTLLCPPPKTYREALAASLGPPLTTNPFPARSATHFGLTGRHRWPSG